MGFQGGSKLGNGNHSTHPSKLQASSGGTIIHLEEFALEDSGLDLAEVRGEGKHTCYSSTSFTREAWE